MARALRSTAVPESLRGRACSVRTHDVFPTQPTTNKLIGQTERQTDRQTESVVARALRSTAVPESLRGRACSVRTHDVLLTQPKTNKQGQTERQPDRVCDGQSSEEYSGT